MVGHLLVAGGRSLRGELIGTAMGAAVFGALFGPVVGALAAAVGRATVFSAVAGLALALAALTMVIESRPPEVPSAAALRRAAASRTFRGGLGLLAFASLLSGVLAVLTPLHLAAAGWGPTAIGAVWLVGAAIEAGESRLIGRVSDRHGALVPVRWALLAGAVTSLGLTLAVGPPAYAALVVLASVAYGVLFTPAFALIADGADRARLAQGMAFGMMNAAWALGAMAGPAAGGAIAGAVGERTPFILVAIACALLLIGLRSQVPAAKAAAPAPRSPTSRSD